MEGSETERFRLLRARPAASLTTRGLFELSITALGLASLPDLEAWLTRELGLGNEGRTKVFQNHGASSLVRAAELGAIVKHGATGESIARLRERTTIVGYPATSSDAAAHP